MKRALGHHAVRAAAGEAALGVGTDVLRISRVSSGVDRWGDSFLSHIFTEGEIVFCRGNRNSLESFAGTLAAKEAAYKALGLGWERAFSWRMIEIVRDAVGRPLVQSSRYSSDAVRRRLADMRVAVSISHEGEYAVAVAVAHPQRSD